MDLDDFLEESVSITHFTFIPLRELGYEEDGDRLQVFTNTLEETRKIEDEIKKFGWRMEYREQGRNGIEMGFEETK